MTTLTARDMVAILCDDCQTMNDWELNFTAAQISKVRIIYFKHMEPHA